MFLKENNRIDFVARRVIKALVEKRFNWYRYATINKYVISKYYQAKVKWSADESCDYKEVFVYDEDGNVAHTITVYPSNEIHLDGTEYREAYRLDRVERDEKRRATIEPLIEVIIKRVQEIIEKIDADDMFKMHTANLFEYCANPHYTAIGASHSYNNGHLLKVFRRILTQHGMECSEGNGVYTMKQVVEMINNGEM